VTGSSFLTTLPPMTEHEESSLSVLSIVLIAGLVLLLGVGCLGALFFGFAARPASVAVPATLSAPAPAAEEEVTLEEPATVETTDADER